MSRPYPHKISLREFYHLREKINEIIEFIDGTVYMAPSPSTKHQRISGRLHAKLFNFLEGKECEVFHAPFDIELSKEELEYKLDDKKAVIVPDLTVVCDKSKLGENKFIGIPELIIEILSPSNQAHDLVTKLNLYMQYGVREYWIVNPMLNSVQIYTLNEEGQYLQMDALKEIGMAASEILKGFRVNLEDLFQ